MLILAGVFAYFSLSAYLAHYTLMAIIFLGIAVCCFIKAIEAENAKTKTVKVSSPKAYPLLQDSNLDRVRFVQINFKDWRKNERLALKWKVSPDRCPGHYEFFFDSRIMVDSMMEKESIVLYDACGHVIPIQNYTYSWDELEYGDGDGSATLKVFPRVAVA